MKVPRFLPLPPGEGGGEGALSGVGRGLTSCDEGMILTPFERIVGSKG
jgi:hypothetical protein